MLGRNNANTKRNTRREALACDNPTLEETLEKVAAHPELAKYEWPVHLEFGGHD